MNIKNNSLLLRWMMFFIGLCACVVAAATETVVIRAGHLIDPATGTVSDDQIILVKDQDIVAVGEDIKIPLDSRVIDLSDAWVLPGLMDAHVHLTVGLPLGSDFTQGGAHGAAASYYMESTALRTLRGLHNAKLMLEAGFTTVRDTGNSANYAMVDVRRAIAKGWFPGPTILDAGKIIGLYGGELRGFSPEHKTPWHFEYIDADTPDEIRKAVRQNVFYGANTIKLVTGYPISYTADDIRVAVEEAARAGLKVAVHTGGENITAAILGGAHSIEHGTGITDKQLRLMKKNGTYLSGTEFPAELIVAMSAERSIAEKAQIDFAQRFRRAFKIGVKVVFSTDVVIDFPDKNRAQMSFEYLKSWIAGGVPPNEIIKSMTTHPAALFGLEKERGAIKPSFKADIIATKDNPLDDINALKKVHFVMKDGVVIR